MFLRDVLHSQYISTPGSTSISQILYTVSKTCQIAVGGIWESVASYLGVEGHT